MGAPYLIVGHPVSEDLPDIYLDTFRGFNCLDCDILTPDGFPHSDETFRLAQGFGQVIMSYAIADKPDTIGFAEHSSSSLVAQRAT